MSTLRRLTREDSAALDSFLGKHRASSMFLLFNLQNSGLSDGPSPYHGVYVGNFKGNELTDVAAHYWNNHIVLQAPTSPLEVSQRVAKESRRQITGVLGPWDQVQHAEPHLDLDRNRLGKNVPECLYSLDLRKLDVPDQLSKTQCRLATDSDLPTLVAWRRIYDRITMGFQDHAISDERNTVKIHGLIDENVLWVLEDQNTLVATTSFNAVLPKAVQVGGVFTDEAYRGRGYARTVVAGSLLEARETGVTEAILFTEMDNYPAQKAYESLGFVRVGDYGMVVLDPA